MKYSVLFLLSLLFIAVKAGGYGLVSGYNNLGNGGYYDRYRPGYGGQYYGAAWSRPQYGSFGSSSNYGGNYDGYSDGYYSGYRPGNGGSSGYRPGYGSYRPDYGNYRPSYGSYGSGYSGYGGYGGSSYYEK